MNQIFSLFTNQLFIVYDWKPFVYYNNNYNGTNVRLIIQSPHYLQWTVTGPLDFVASRPATRMTSISFSTGRLHPRSLHPRMHSWVTLRSCRSFCIEPNSQQPLYNDWRLIFKSQSNIIVWIKKYLLLRYSRQFIYLLVELFILWCDNRHRHLQERMIVPLHQLLLSHSDIFILQNVIVQIVDQSM